jgi:multimeric flavodoxin WrbA
MKIVLIHGRNHKGSTYHIGKMLADKIGGEREEFFLPRDFDQFCIGCNNCFMKGESLCPHYEKLVPITTAMDEADVLIFTSPVYVYHATGAMKAFLDHYGYRWMVHRPQEKMFSKQAVCISTAAGAGMKSTNKDMADSLFFWGIPKIYQYGVAVRAISYDTVSAKIRKKIDQKTTRIAKKIKANNGKAKPGIKTKGFFYIMRMVMKSGWNKADCMYWEEKGWTQKARPWKVE